MAATPSSLSDTQPSPPGVAAYGANLSLQGYCRLLDAAAKAGYRACPLTEADPPTGAKTLWLRHDVDISPVMALRLGEREAERGMRSSFFFQLNTEAYHLLAEPNLRIVRRLRELGHCVGLHIDQLLTGAEEEAIDQTLRWFAETVTPIDRVVSFHRPTPEVLGRRYNAFLNAYDPRVFSEESYCSDSRRSIAFWGRFCGWMAEGRPRLQLLTHPVWWAGHADPAGVWRDVRTRRTAELSGYLLGNFRKVFSGVVPNEDRPTGV